jgi:TorA maturation chaperone TorD
VELSVNATGKERARLYGFLAEVFCSAPTPQTTRVMSQAAAALEIPCPEDVPLRELAREFADLFRVPNPRYVAPYESVYRDRWLLAPAPGAGPEEGAAPLVMERLLMGESTVAVRQCFLEAGVLPYEDLPDHLGNELRLMAHLWASEAGHPGNGSGTLEELRARLRDDHLLRWVKDLRTKVMETERLGFYSAALQLVETVLENEAAEEVPP